MSDLPAPPPEKNGPFQQPREEKRPSRFGPIALFVGFLVVAAIVGAYLFGGEAPAVVPPSEPSPQVTITAPSDEVVLTELTAQLKVFRSQGGEAANARLSSYRQGVLTAGCKVGLSHGTNFTDRAEARARGAAYIEAARVALEKQGASFGGAAVVDKTEEGDWDYYALFVTCPPA